MEKIEIKKILYQNKMTCVVKRYPGGESCVNRLTVTVGCLSADSRALDNVDGSDA